MRLPTAQWILYPGLGFAYVNSGDMRWIKQIERMVDYWWPMLDERNLLSYPTDRPNYAHLAQLLKDKKASLSFNLERME